MMVSERLRWWLQPDSHLLCSVLFSLLLLAVLPGCGEIGEGDNSPAAILDTPEEAAARAERRAASPGAQIYGQAYEFIDAVIDGRVSTPGGSEAPRITLEDRLVKGVDGCVAFSAMTGIFSPSGYEFSFMDSGPLRSAQDSQAYPCSEPGREQWLDLFALENRVWSLSIDAAGVLTLKDYNGAPYSYRLRPAKDSP